MDPLSLLRDYTVRNEVESIQQVGNEIEFGEDYKFPCNMETAYRSKQGSLYTLEALVFFVKNTHLKHTLYMQQARSLKLQIITFTDRKPLLDYLEGKVSTTDAIELLAPAVGALPSSRDERERLARLNQDDETGEFHGLNDVGSGPAKRLWSTVDDWEADLDGKYLDSSRLIDLIRERERPIRDRETILLCPNKSFQGILAMLSKRDEEKKKTEEQQRKEQEKSSEPSMPPPNPSNRFAKVEEKRFWRDHLGTDAEELGIDPTQSYIEDAAKQKEAAPSKPRPADLRRPYNHTPQRFVSSSPSSSISKAKPEGVPIILVPNALQTLLNTYNAKEFLEDGIYVAPDVKAKINGKKPEVIHIQRKMGRPVPVKYEVRDKATSLFSKDWERVVAVFVLGKEWQFKDWPFKDHVDILNKILGVYLRFEDDSMESVKVVKQWNVKIISLSKHKRHQDRTAVLEFWDKVDAFIRARKLNIVF